MNESPHESGHAPAYRITTVLLSVLLAMVNQWEQPGNVNRVGGSNEQSD